MLVAIVSSQTQFPTINGGAGGQTGYQVSLTVKWADSDSQIQGAATADVFAPQGTKRSHFNQMIIDALVAAVNASSALSLDPSNLFFVPFENG